jgi:hypothetical protein
VGTVSTTNSIHRHDPNYEYGGKQRIIKSIRTGNTTFILSHPETSWYAGEKVTTTTGTKASHTGEFPQKLSSSTQSDSFTVDSKTIIRFELSRPGKLGMEIGHFVKIPPSLQRILSGGRLQKDDDNNNNKLTTNLEACIVTHVEPGSLAYEAGLQKGDCFVDVCSMDDTNDHHDDASSRRIIKLRSYHDVRTSLKTDPRPMSVWVVRMHSQSSSLTTTGSTSVASPVLPKLSSAKKSALLPILSNKMTRAKKPAPAPSSLTKIKVPAVKSRPVVTTKVVAQSTPSDVSKINTDTSVVSLAQMEAPLNVTPDVGSKVVMEKEKEVPVVSKEEVLPQVTPAIQSTAATEKKEEVPLVSKEKTIPEVTPGVRNETDTTPSSTSTKEEVPKKEVSVTEFANVVNDKANISIAPLGENKMVQKVPPTEETPQTKIGNTPPRDKEQAVENHSDVPVRQQQTLQHPTDIPPPRDDVVQVKAPLTTQSGNDWSTTRHPFCRKCTITGQPIAMHHAWCPKNGQFEVSGAKEILKDLRCGLALKCEVCKAEYASGRSIKDGIHRLECPRRIPVDKMATQKKSSQKTPTKTKAAGTSTALVSTSGRKIRPTAKVRFASKSTLSLLGSQGEDDSELSEYDLEEVEPTKRIASKKSTNSSQGRSAAKKTSSNAAKDSNQHSPRAVDLSEELEALLEIEKDPDAIEVTWNVSDDPWGPESLENWDRVVFCSTLPLTQQEGVLLSERFVHDPFSSHPRYCKSHTTPEEGSHALVLHRTALCNASWGFSVDRHEFGGACLVKDVTPMSPASVAVSIKWILQDVFSRIPSTYS